MKGHQVADPKAFGLKKRTDPEISYDDPKYSMTLLHRVDRVQLRNWEQGRGHDPLQVLLRLENEASHHYDWLSKNRFPPTPRKETYIRRYLKHNVNR